MTLTQPMAEAKRILRVAVFAMVSVLLVVAGVVWATASFPSQPSARPTSTATPEVETLVEPLEAGDTDSGPSEAGVTDLGPRVGAMGAVELTPEGHPAHYTVVEGDTADAIRGRFDLWWDQLSRDGVQLSEHPVVYPGDVLTIILHDPQNQ